MSKPEKAHQQKKKASQKEDLKVLIKPPKGTRDYTPIQMNIREELMATIRRCFQRHGATQIDTPVFELKEILTSKYGEEGNKLIYDLADQGEGEKLSMRYDLTVPFARYIATNGVKKMKRFQFGKVYRRDQPYMTRGRQREFCQCDFDIAGEYDPMMPDAEVVSILAEVLTDLQVGDFKIRINHRGLLDGVFGAAGVAGDKMTGVFSTIDKLDKQPWNEIRDELIKVRGLSEEVADRLGEYVRLHCPLQGLATLFAEQGIGAVAGTAAAEMELLARYCDALGCSDRVEFDLSLVRGLDYYTGVIFEAVMVVGTTNVGSIAGGGRYDHLVGIFGPNSIPCVGFSVGLERIAIVLEEKLKGRAREAMTEVFVASIDKNQTERRMAWLGRLWRAGINAEMIQRLNPKIKQELRDADEVGCTWALIFGESEVTANEVILKNLRTKTQVRVANDRVVPALVARLMRPEVYATEDPELFATDEEVAAFAQRRHALNVAF